MSGRSVSRRPVHVLTGFLGSGKTTLLRHWLADPACRDTAVVVNEFGEVGLDHLLLREVARDIVLLQSGCLCCTVRDDLVSTLEELDGLATAGSVPAFARVAVETTGLADPAPVIQVIMGEPRLAARFRLGRIITTADAVNGATTLERHAEALQQAMFADHLVLTKGDLAGAAQLALLTARLRRINPDATIATSSPGSMPSPDALLAEATLPSRPPPGPPAMTAHRHGTSDHDVGGHDIDSFSIAVRPPVPRDRFTEWLALLLFSRGEQILRVKGVLRFEGEDRPQAIQGVQHVVYPPEYLEGLTDDECFLVFITRGITRSAVERSLTSMLTGRR